MLKGTINIKDLRSFIDINEINYPEGIKDQLSDKITRDAKCNLERHRNEEQISSLPIIQEILFFTAEYKKRKFYLDCTVKKEGDVYIKNNKSYVQAIPNDRSSAEMIISNRFLAKTDCVLYFGKDMGYERYNYKIYDFFKGEYEHSLNLIKDIVHSPNKYGLDLLENEQNIFSSFKRYASNNDKCYERLLYSLGDHDFISESRYASQYLLNIIREPFLQRTTPRAVEILKNIVDIYGLYLSDLFQPTDVEHMVKNKQYKLSPIPYMFSINNLEDNIVDITPPQKASKVTIKFVINSRLNRCCTPAGLDDDNILSAVYAYEHTNQVKLNDNKYIGCSENDKILEVTYNLKKQPSIPERCMGLYIWDKLHKKKTGDSISQIVRHLFFNDLEKNIKNETRKRRGIKSEIKKGERCLTGTTHCIERMKLLSLSSKDINNYKKIQEKQLESIENKNENKRHLFETLCLNKNGSLDSSDDILESLFRSHRNSP